MNSNKNRNDHFFFSGCDTVELAQKYQTPLYVMSEDLIVERIGQIQENFLQKYENTKAVYASKAFLTKEMCRIIKREGLGMDVVSGGELYTAIQADFPMEDIVFHGNNKTLDELKMAVEYGVGRIVVDNLYELELLEHTAKELGKTMKIVFRITPGVDSHTHQYIQTGQIDSKFGIPLQQDQLLDAVKKAMTFEHIELMGFHFHVGSQLFDHTSHVKAVGILVEWMKKVKDQLEYETQEINTGGGFGIYYTEKDSPKPVHYFTDAIMETLIEDCEKLNLSVPKVTIEPGRWIVGEAGITLYTIGSIKKIPNVRTYVAVDGGMPDNPRPALYDAQYEAVIANKMDEAKDQLVTIAGKCCESGDILRYDLKVPYVESGDILAFKSTGAYNYSMASHYNKLRKPAVVMIKDGVDRLIVKRETYDDLIKNEL